MLFQCSTCKKCKLPIFIFASCECKHEWQEQEEKTIDQDAHTQVDSNCNLTNGYFREDAWEPGMILSTRSIITRQELLRCKSNDEVKDLLLEREFTNFER